MAVKMTQSLKQTQNLMMTPQLQQAIKLLTLTHLEMTNVIASEMVENPVLEERDAELGERKDDVLDKLEKDTKEASADNFSEPTLMKKDDFDWEGYVDSFNSNSSAPPSSMASYDADELPNYENMVSKGMNLQEHLEWQLRMENLTEDEWKLSQSIIHNINDNGYLSLPFEELIVDCKLHREDAFEILKMIQSLDPVGCGAQNLKECLTAQATVLDQRSPLLELVINDHLEDLLARDHAKIAEVTGVNIERIKDVEMLIQSFNPKPGRLISPADTHYVVPDIFVTQVGNKFEVALNDEGVPHLKISKLYQRMLASGDEKAKEYVQDKLRSAMWLIKSIENRQRTILKVAKAIVEKQQDFFLKGIKHMKPMILKDIASEIEMHESTVSRVTTNKYMHTPIGVFELKYFFNSGIGGKNGGEDVAGEVLKLTIKELIGNEDSKKPLSDQKIVELLGRRNIKVARRTIAKYREMMGILSSAKRKKRA